LGELAKLLIPHSIQRLKRLRPTLFGQDLSTLLDLLQQKKIKPLIAQRFPLAEASRGVTGKIVLVCSGQ